MGRSPDLAAGLPLSVGTKENVMLQSAAKSIDVRALPIEWIAGTVAMGSVTWLLATDRIPPALVYLVQLFLSF